MIKSFKNLLRNNQNYFTKKTVPEKETVFYVFKEIIREEFGQAGLEKFIPDYFSDGTLFIKTQGSVWAAELWTNRERIIKKINGKTGQICVREIKAKQ